MGSIAESGNDETILPLESLKKFLPADKLWPINDFWYMRAGSAPGNSTLESAKAAIAKLDDGSGVLVITDVMGGTPSNCTIQLNDPGRVEVIAGISLPMLLRAITYRNDTLDVVVEMALAGGQSGVVRVDNRVRLSPS